MLTISLVIDVTFKFGTAFQPLLVERKGGISLLSEILLPITRTPGCGKYVDSLSYLSFFAIVSAQIEHIVSDPSMLIYGGESKQSDY